MLLDYLAVADPEFRPDLTAKIAALVQRFAPDKRWHFDSLLQVGRPRSSELSHPKSNPTIRKLIVLDYLAVADPEFRPDLTAKIAALVQRFAPDKRWHFDSLLQVGRP